MSSEVAAVPESRRSDLWARLIPIVVPALWLAPLLLMGIAEAIADPDQNKPIGETLDTLSWLWFLTGIVFVPTVTTVSLRVSDQSWGRSIILGALSLALFALGAAIQYLIWTKVILPA